MKGGYIMIDCGGLNLLSGETPQTIGGLYGACDVAMQTGKPIFANNLLWGTLYVSPVHAFGIRTATGEITFTASTLQVVVKSDDSVVVHNMVS